MEQTYSFAGHSPSVAEDAWLAPGAAVIGRATLAARTAVWFNAVVRADAETISIDEESNIQDGCALHADPGAPLTVGKRVSVGHNAVLHGCTVEDDVLIGMGATVMNHARIGTGSIVAAGALVTEGTQIPPNSLVAGVPGKVRRETTEQERDAIGFNASGYVALMEQYRG
ncbi:gamma carbonic anhydrase family protein [Rhodococcoides kroppenstedtii]|uniref:gamma carbonic anhydrase family protein n=1 Tax=Rhodococcoides kroppenstedtii TaxID=293050 RepID=UPI001BDE9C19|nr:gamma carbonic anhydrase family protein [Rhodococcus kroppenstedtii]MBT1192675.1 gamma carbonic anhydrase family protein [Rhodococcus kroppenstedtii]